MSAFMVEDSTINRIVAYVRSEINKHNSSYEKRYYADELFPEYMEDGLFRADRLGEALFILNAKGVDSRYGEGEAGKFRPLDYKYEMGARPDLHQALKSLRCLLYQCSEDDVPETDLFSKMEKLSDSLCYKIATSCPAYEKAEWR